MAEFDQYISETIAEMDGQRRQKLTTAGYATADVNPEREAGLRLLAKQAEVPAEALYSDDGAEAKRMAQAKQFEMLPSYAPRTAEFVSDPENAKVSHDDLAALAKVENLFQTKAADVMGIASTNDRQAARTVKSALKPYAELAGQAIEKAPHLAMKGINETLLGVKKMGFSELPDEPLLENMTIVSNRIKGIEDRKPQTEGQRYAQMTFDTLAANLLTAPLGVGGKLPMLAGFVAIAPGNLDDYLEAGYSPVVAAALSLSNKAMEGLTEMIGVGQLFKGGVPLARRAAGFLGGDLLGEEINNAYSQLVAKNTLQPDLSFDDFKKSVLDTAIVTALAGGGQMAMTQPFVALSNEFERAANARQNQQLMEALGEAATESKLQTRLPEKFREFVSAVRADGPVENAYIPAEEWDTYWQSKNVDPQKMADQVLDDGGTQYLEALAAGGDLVIPIEVYAERMAATERHADLSRHVRLRQGDMTLAEADAFDQEKDERIQQLVEQLKAEAENVERPSWMKIYDDLYGQLSGVFDRATAERYATLGAVRARTRAERLGLDAFDLYNEQPLKIARPLPEALRRKTVDTGIDPLLDRLRAADVPTDEAVFGPSLLQFLRDKGIQDEGGELAAMDANIATRKPGKRSLVRADGLPLDKAREAAAEAGYLADDSTVRDLLDLIDTELRGTPAYSNKPVDEQAFGLKATLAELQTALEERGIDLAQMDNEAVRRELFQGDGGGLWQAKRGFFRTSPTMTAREIGILESADLSTFIHELSHSWLEELKQDAERPDAPEQLREDWETIKAWAGIEGDTIPVEAHELFARAGEAYVMEGNAPSAELRGVFQRFKAWLTRIYKELTGLNVRLNDDVRRVFDRLLATDEEIQAAEQDQDYEPIFATAADANMTEAEFAAYRTQAELASQEARDTLEKKLMAELTREQRAWWKEEREKLRAVVEEEAKEEPVYQVFQLLTKGKLFDGTTPDGDVTWKLNRDELVKMYGEPFLKRLPRSKEYIYSAEGGTSVEFVAELFGFSSGDEMIRRLIESPKMKAWIEAETDLRMKMRHGDMLLDGTMADEAIKAVHSDRRADVIRAELAAIRRKQRELSPFIKKVQREAVDRERREREYEMRWMEAEQKLALAIERGAAQEEIRKIREEAKAAKEESQRQRREMFDDIPPISWFREVAATTIGQKRAMDVDPRLYLNAERKASREAFKAAAKGEFATAGEQKYKQLLNHYLYMEAVKAREESDEIRDYMMNLSKRKNLGKIGKASEEFLLQVDAILSRYEFVKTPLSRIETLAEWLDRMAEEYGLDIPIDEEVMQQRVVNYRELTMDELRAVYDSVRAIVHAAKMVNRVKKDLEELDMDEAEQELIDRAHESIPEGKPLHLTDSSLSFLEKAGETLRNFDLSLIRPERLIEWLDGGSTGPWHELLWNRAVDADNRRNELRGDVLPRLQSLMDGMAKERKERLTRKVKIETLGESLTYYEMIGIALNTGNQSNMDKLMKGGLWFGEEKKLLLPDALAEILGNLDEQDAQLVQGMWDAVNSLWPEISRIEKLRSGLEPKKVEATPVTIGGVQLSGGYWPMVYDSRHSAQGEKQSDSNRRADQMFGANFTKASTRKGHTKERVQNFSRPVQLDWRSVVSRHVDNVITDVSHWEFVFQTRRLLARDGVKKAVQTRVGETAFRSLEGWLKYTVNADYYGDPAAAEWSKARQVMTSNLAVAALGFKVMTAVGNVVVAPVQGLDRVSPKWMARGIGEFLRNPKAAMAMARELSGQMKNRQLEVDRTLQETINSLAGKDSMRAQIGRASMTIHLWADRLASTALWLGAYREALEKGDTELQAIRIADKAIRMTQTAGAPKDLSAFERHPMSKEVSMFLGPMLIMGNGIRSVFGSKGGVNLWSPEAFGKLFALWFGPAIIFELAVGRGPDGDDEEGWAKWGLTKLLLYPLQTIPIIRDMASMLEALIIGHRAPTSRGLPVMEAGKAMVNAAQKTYKAIADDGDTDKAVKADIKAAGLLFGLPTGQLSITGEFLYDVLSGNYEPENPWSPARDLLMRRKDNK